MHGDVAGWHLPDTATVACEICGRGMVRTRVVPRSQRAITPAGAREVGVNLGQAGRRVAEAAARAGSEVVMRQHLVAMRQRLRAAAQAVARAAALAAQAPAAQAPATHHRPVHASPAPRARGGREGAYPGPSAALPLDV